jgi:hypothetical protein
MASLSESWNKITESLSFEEKLEYLERVEPNIIRYGIESIVDQYGVQRIVNEIASRRNFNNAVIAQVFHLEEVSVDEIPIINNPIISFIHSIHTEDYEHARMLFDLFYMECICVVELPDKFIKSIDDKHLYRILDSSSNAEVCGHGVYNLAKIYLEFLENRLYTGMEEVRIQFMQNYKGCIINDLEKLETISKVFHVDSKNLESSVFAMFLSDCKHNLTILRGINKKEVLKTLLKYSPEFSTLIQ